MSLSSVDLYRLQQKAGWRARSYQVQLSSNNCWSRLKPETCCPRCLGYSDTAASCETHWLQADIVCNIVDKLGKNIDMCSCLVHYCGGHQVLHRLPLMLTLTGGQAPLPGGESTNPHQQSQFSLAGEIEMIVYYRQELITIGDEKPLPRTGEGRSWSGKVLLLLVSSWSSTREGDDTYCGDADAEDPEDGDKKRKKKVMRRQ